MTETTSTNPNVLAKGTPENHEMMEEMRSNQNQVNSPVLESVGMAIEPLTVTTKSPANSWGRMVSNVDAAKPANCPFSSCCSGPKPPE